MLAEAGALDAGDLVIRALALLREHPHVRAQVAERYRHVLVDDVQEPNFAHGLLLRLLAAEHGNLAAAGDDDQAIHRFRAAATKNLRDFQAELPDATVVQLEQSFRCPPRILDAAAAVVAPLEDRIEKRLRAGGRGRAGPGEVAFWRAANERAQAQSVAADVERLIGREGVAPERIAVLVRSIGREGQAVSVALEERAVGHRLVGDAAFFQRTEVRDLLAWLRLLIDPADAPAVVRALARPPIELQAIDLARCTQIARRRKLDMVAALAAALESPQIPPETRDRIRTFLSLHRSASSALDTIRPDLFVHRLIERLGLRRQQLFTAQAEVVERLQGLARFGELASAYVAAPAAGEHARVRALDRGRRRGRAARGGRPAARRGARRAGARDARGAGAGVRPRLRARAARRAHARRAHAHARADRAGADEGGAAAGRPRRARRRDAAAAARRDDARAAAARARAPAGERPRRGAAALAVRGGGARGASARSGRSARRSCSAPTSRCTRRTGSCATSCWRRSSAPARASASCASTPTSTSRTRSCATWSW